MVKSCFGHFRCRPLNTGFQYNCYLSNGLRQEQPGEWAPTRRGANTLGQLLQAKVIGDLERDFCSLFLLPATQSVSQSVTPKMRNAIFKDSRPSFFGGTAHVCNTARRRGQKPFMIFMSTTTRPWCSNKKNSLLYAKKGKRKKTLKKRGVYDTSFAHIDDSRLRGARKTCLEYVMGRSSGNHIIDAVRSKSDSQTPIESVITRNFVQTFVDWKSYDRSLVVKSASTGIFGWVN